MPPQGSLKVCRFYMEWTPNFGSNWGWGVIDRDSVTPAAAAVVTRVTRDDDRHRHSLGHSFYHRTHVPMRTTATALAQFY